MGKKYRNRVIGIGLLIVGLALLAWGFDVYGAFGSRLSRAISGDISGEALVLFGAGGICSALGLFRLIGK